jgi:hypothetical protein
MDEELIAVTVFACVNDFIDKVLFEATSGKNRWWLGQDSRGE